MYKKIFFISLLIFITFQVFGQEDDIEKAKNDIVNQINTHHKIKDCTCRKNELLLYNILSTRMSFHPTSNEGIITHEVIYINLKKKKAIIYHPFSKAKKKPKSDWKTFKKKLKNYKIEQFPKNALQLYNAKLVAFDGGYFILRTCNKQKLKTYHFSDNIVIATYHNDDLEKIKKSKEALHRTLDFCNFIQNEFSN